VQSVGDGGSNGLAKTISLVGEFRTQTAFIRQTALEEMSTRRLPMMNYYARSEAKRSVLSSTTRDVCTITPTHSTLGQGHWLVFARRSFTTNSYEHDNDCSLHKRQTDYSRRNGHGSSNQLSTKASPPETCPLLYASTSCDHYH
jgi:hypothetical protein